MLINIISVISILWPPHITSQESSDELSIRHKTQWGKFNSFQPTLPSVANSNLTFTHSNIFQSMNCIHFKATWQRYQVCAPEPVRLLGSISWLIL